MDPDDARTIGRRVRQVRKSRDKPLPVIAGPAGMSKSKTISSCKVKPGGPALGRFILQRTNDKWYITGRKTEKC